MSFLRAFSFLVLTGGVLCGCNKPAETIQVQNEDPSTEPMSEPDMFVTDTGGGIPVESGGSSMIDPYAGDAYGGSSMPVASLPPASVDMGGGRSHMVQKGETLYSLARKYYNDQSRWKDIYSANAGQISDANRIRVGQSLIIP